MGSWQRDNYFTRLNSGQLPRVHKPRFNDSFADLDWIGEDVFIVGGGPSVLDHDLSVLEGRKVITVNMGYRAAKPTIAYFGSILLLMRASREADFNDIVGVRAALEAMVWNTKSQYGCHVMECSQEEWGSDFITGVPVFSNSGLVAVNMADILGAENIYLIGFDMRGEKGRTVNFHDYYPDNMRPPESHYDTYRNDFDRVPLYGSSNVWNCNKASALRTFPYRPLKDAIR